MADRLDSTQAKISGVKDSVGRINIGPESMGLIGSGFTREAQAHLQHAQQQLATTGDTVARASQGTRQTAATYQNTDATAAAEFARIDTTDSAPRPPGQTLSPGPASQPALPSPSISARLDSDTASTTTRPTTELYEPSPAERALQTRRVIDSKPMDPTGHANDAHLVTFDDGTRGIYKPIAGENVSLRQGIPGNLAHREVAASRIDEAFGFGLVPTTTMIDGQHGIGSVQQWVASTPHREHHEYPRIQQERMAVLDYIIGNTDRHLGNYRTDPDGNVLAIDHGYSFPESPDPRFGIRSDFVDKNLNIPLSGDVLARVRAVDSDHLRHTLRATGISETAIHGVLARLTEIRTHGMITGEAWPGVINGAFAPSATQPMSANRSSTPPKGTPA
ncbi:hypothetical protein [Actinophytocola sp.]|uniref:hypothetical protein n=1 Tax=Actinophytocola sp. TaxID=1872138 RepID=UPI002D7F2781|nr:hypothetical protein [Actinophytocola sp.]HET9143308.1 hypothetical protein [Actinophytocola sp.]